LINLLPMLHRIRVSLSKVIVVAILFFFAIPCTYSQKPCETPDNKKIGKLYDQGTAAYKRGNYLEAGQIMKAVINAEPGFVDAYYVLGLVNFKKANSNFREAERNFMKVLELCPAYDIHTYYYLGEICYGTERFDSTVMYLSEFLKDEDKMKPDKDYPRASEILKYSKFYLDMIRHPVPFEPKVLAGVSTPENEYLPGLSPDNQMALFTREVMIPPEKNSIIQTTKYKEKFMYSIKKEDGIFSEGQEMPEPFNMNDNEGGATLTVDNNTLYYTVCKYTKDRSYYNCDIYSSEFVNGEWTPIKSVSDKVNLPFAWESQPSISSDGKTLYFISDRPGGYGGYDVYRSIKNSAGEWGTPMNLGPNINTPGNEKSPFIHPDDRTLYFSSDGWMGMGGYDVFYSRIDSTGSWSKPVNMGYPLNSPDDEVGFIVSTDGAHGYFASNKYKGKGGWDVFSFELYKDAQPDKVLLLKGTVKTELDDDQQPVKARIELKNVDTKKTSEIPLDSTTGNYVAVAPFNSDYIMTVKKEGYVYDAHYISRIDSIFKAPAKLDVKIEPIELHKSYRINDIYFDFNSYQLKDESKLVLDQLIDFLNENPLIRIEIQGHTDNIGNDADNLRLSDNRAQSVYDYLISRNISKGRLTYKGFGKTLPVADNDTESGRAKNRRTVFVITSK
jgi:outer membrane protein OmpA-like peptidoglycan-associated protein/tetratricopeptide (TPR) repeat protein